MDFFKVLFFEKIGAAVAYSGKDWEALFAASVGGYPIATITGLPPLYFSANGSNLTDYTVSGNTVQDGTPSPQATVDVVGCGAKTGNLWSNRGFSATTITSNHTHNISNNYGTTLSTTEGDEVTITQSAYPTGNVGYQNGFFMIDVDFSKYAVGDVVTISFDYIVNEIHALSTQTATAVYAGKNTNTTQVTLSSGDWKISGRLTAVITIIAGMNPYVEVRLCGNSITVKNVMLNLGSTALPYEPYGYKLPITVNGTEYPIYLGNVQTTRRIGKIDLSGLSWSPIASGLWKTTGIPNIKYVSVNTEVGDGIAEKYTIHTGAGMTTAPHCIAIDVSQVSVNTGDRSVLPTGMFWYVLAEPETAVVNEPLNKIGNYADTITMAQAGETIPTIAGSNTLTVGATVQPSSVSITGHIKPTTP